ncbi:acyl carrier protein phosphodiesterase [Maribellus maritimus]|uniref:acyl carrier protein phosphodiesterase n=1 Tax=Maribellus maritimus TaxID=2870838 RepID=UPI001EEA0227|nr:ACP phosphodiesterase [Maribellus maritimus]MCG6186138.1 ACP phosphodiesterase [Maribellus maritimus]
MNYLAHLYLSGKEEDVIVGNFIGDYVKGKKYINYPGPVQKGILLHRQIDSFTDTNPKFREAKQLLLAEYGLHAGVVIDLFYDHFLARNWPSYSQLILRDFTKKIHAILLSHFFYLPKRVQGFLPFLIQHKRLESYATIEGIQKTLEIMSSHTSLPAKSEKAIEILRENFIFFENNFTSFMDEMFEFVTETHQIKIKKSDWIAGL